ncbi:hypothetical protein SAMN02910276_02019 [Butyrivibrio sp. Su6]|uniref:hypothetical protein n=1 Tax=Butyrivibrio sp. Su6 TaxID=1520810 RepID=UPI00089ECFDC|nr:hypothetical protein [Butyrivibrio sp. Su6]SEG15832.1 hypothetical protein SAMN02910276_02019 [Butyrivibrio sp. Su6]
MKKFYDYIFSKKTILLITFIVVSVMNLIFAFNHEYWRDETQAWLIARDCSLSADSLFTVTSYEGHPVLWFLILMPFAKLGVSVEILKYLTWFFVTVSLYLFMFKTDIPALLRVLIALTPAYVYFYVVPARSYSLASLLIICISVVYEKRSNKPILYGLLLSGLLQTLTIMGGFVTALGFSWFIETIIFLIQKKDKKMLVKNIVGLFILLASALFLLWEFRYTPISGDSHSKKETIMMLWEQYLFGYKIIFGNIFNKIAIITTSVVVMLFMLNKKSRIPVIITCCGVMWQVYIYAFVYSNANHRVITWIYMMLFCVIVSYIYKESIYSMKNLSLVVIMCVIIAFSWKYEWRDLIKQDINPDYCFSYSKEVAQKITGLPEDSIILSLSADKDSSVVAQVDKNHVVYDVFTGRVATFADRNPECIRKMTIKELYDRVSHSYSGTGNIYAIVSADGCDVENFSDYIKEGHDELEIIYESSHKGIFEDFYLVSFNLINNG